MTTQHILFSHALRTPLQHHSAAFYSAVGDGKWRSVFGDGVDGYDDDDDEEDEDSREAAEVAAVLEALAVSDDEESVADDDGCVCGVV